MWYLVANAVSFQAMWFIAVLFGDTWPLGAVFLLVLFNLFCLKIIYGKCFAWANELLTLALCLVVGFLVEVFNLRIGVWSDATADAVPPGWLLALWVAFATSLHGSLAFLQKRLGLAALAGLIFSPISYFAGAKLSPSYALADSTWSLVIIGMTWFLVMPFLMFIAEKLPPVKPLNTAGMDSDICVMDTKRTISQSDK